MHRVEHVMGTVIGVEVRDRRVPEDILDPVYGWLRYVDATFSTYRSDSEISRLHRGELALKECAAEVGEVLERCEVLRRETDGFFDARYADALVDPTGLVKGWAVDFAGELLRRSGARCFCNQRGRRRAGERRGATVARGDCAPVRPRPVGDRRGGT